MNKSIRRLLPLLIFLSSTGLLARTLVTPWSLGLYNGHMHAPLPRPTDCDDACYTYDVWAAGLHRESNKAYRDKHGTKTDQSLAGIVFGKEKFVGLDAFAPGTTSPANPFLAFAQLTPRFDYRENSAYFGFTIERAFGCDCRWHGGVRALLPFRSIKVEVECCDLEEEGISDVCRLQDEHIRDQTGNLQTVQECYAYRLDFLSSLFIEQAGEDLKPLVEFVSAPPLNNMKIAAVDVTDFPVEPNPVHILQRDDETPPEEGPFCKLNTIVSGLPFVQGDGSGLVNNQQGRFQQDPPTSYAALGNDKAAQRKLWVEPTAMANVNDVQMLAGAETIGTEITNIVRKLGRLSAVGFFKDHGVNFNTQHIVGVGDLDTQFYLNYEFCRSLVEGVVGVRWPTGVKAKDPGELYTIFSTGNNRHFELQLGLLGTWEPTCWFIFKGDAYWSYAFKRDELVGAPFRGATVKNIGPCVKADISWQSFVGHADFNFLVPCNPRVGFMVGYEGYVKSKDNVSLQQSSAKDFLGNTQPLDPCVLERRTKVVSHKIRTEMFHQGDYFEIYGGWSHVLAGKNAPNESDWHLGFVTYF